MSEEEVIEIIKDFLELREIHSSDSMTKSYLSVYKEAIQGLLDLYNKEKEKREIAEENHKVLSLDLGQALKDLGLPEDTIISDELVLEINKRYVSKDKIKEKIEEYYEYDKKMQKEKDWHTNEYYKAKTLEELLKGE